MAQSNAFKFANNILTNGGYDAADLVGAVGGGVNTPSFLATVTTNQTITHNTFVKMQFNNEVFDTNSAYDPTTNYRFTVPASQGGKYFIFANVMIEGSNNIETYSAIDIRVNGNTNNQFISPLDLTQAPYILMNGSAIISLSATDYVEIFVTNYQYSGTASIVTLDGARCNFGGFKLIE
jgi:hypothetical protein